MCFISSFDIISAVFPDPKILLWFLASACDAAAVNPDGNKTLLANGLITFFITGNPVFNMYREVYQEILLVASS